MTTAAEHAANIQAALDLGPTEGRWRPLVTRIDSEFCYQILHLDLHGKTERERDANREYIVSTQPAALRALLAEREQSAMAVRIAQGDAEKWKVVAETLEADARRYRWLRAQPNDTSAPRIDVVRWQAMDEADNSGEGLRGGDLDAATDAAIAAQQKDQQP